MPVNLGSRRPAESEARIEIIPLIDIMFFLLAAFMLVSLSLVNLKSVRVNLPTATATAITESSANLLSISVDRAGLFYLDRTLVGATDLAAALAAARLTNAGIRVFISGDRDARHGDIIRALDLVRSSGIDRVAFEIRQAEKERQP